MTKLNLLASLLSSRIFKNSLIIILSTPEGFVHAGPTEMGLIMMYGFFNFLFYLK